MKKVFEKPFESTNVRTIEQKLRVSKSTKERITIHTADQMDKLFAHFQRKVSQNLNQLLSRVKTLFGHKVLHEEKPTEPTTQQPPISD